MAYALTKLDLAALRKADFLTVNLEGRGSTVRAVKRAEPDARNPFAQDCEHVIAAPVAMHGGSYGIAATALHNGAARCWSMVNFYHSQNTAASTVVASLREGDEIEFSFYPDALTNGYVAKAGLHGDALYLLVRRNGKRLQWELDRGICPENSARMCRGVPVPEWYLSSAAAA